MLWRDWFSLVWLSVTVNFMGKACRPLAGGGPASTHFSCLAKKSEQKKATQALLHFRFPIVHYKNGSSVHRKLFSIWFYEPLSQEKFDSRDAEQGVSRSNMSILRGQTTPLCTRKSNLSQRSIMGTNLALHALATREYKQ